MSKVQTIVFTLFFFGYDCLIIHELLGGNSGIAWGLIFWLVITIAVGRYMESVLTKMLDRISKLPKEEQQKIWQALRNGWHIDLP